MAEKGFKRKLTAILSADVIGYSRLMRDDEEATVRDLAANRVLITEIIQQHNGRVIDSPGDNILAEFASVVDAVNGAIKIQEEIKKANTGIAQNRRMEFRIGINVGDVIEEEERIYGDGVNIAARVEGLAAGGGIAISGTVYEHIKDKLSLGYHYLGEQDVKNIPEPVRVYRLLTEPEDAGKMIEAEKPKENKRRYVAFGAFALIILVTGALVIWNYYFRVQIEPASLDKMAFPLPDKPSIAVLPFENMSSDPSQDYFSDGLTDQIISTLSKFRSIFVISRTSTFVYKRKPVKIQKVAEDLGVKYVLEGSVQRTADRIRITAQLIDATTGRHIWSERYDREQKEIFAIQDDITLKITKALRVKFTLGEQARLWAKSSTTNLAAWEKYVQAADYVFRFSKEDNASARRLLEEAIVLDPMYADAYVGLSTTHFFDARLGWVESRAESLKMTLKYAQKALELNDTLDSAYLMIGGVYFLQGQYEKAIAEAERAVALNPNGALAYSGLAGFVGCSGRWDESVELAKKSIRLQPFPPASYYHWLGRAYFMTEQYDEAIATFNKALHANPNYLPAHAFLAACYSSLDRQAEAESAAKEVLRINPKFTLESYATTLPYKNKADIERYVAALRKAGLPEHPPLSLPDKPSIAVLPFDNLSKDPEQEYFVDGMTDDLITDLSKISGLFVIARNSTFQYKGKAVDVKKVSRELGIRYVLEGSVRRVGDKVRINAQLIDATTGGHLWAERYDGQMDDIFSLQDKVTQKIVSALAVKLTKGEQERSARKETDNILAYDTLLKGWEHYRRFTPDDFAKARIYFEKAIDIDSDYTRAHAALAQTYWLGSQLGWRWQMGLDVGWSEGRLLARKHLIKAMEKPTSLAHQVASWMNIYRRMYHEAITDAKQAITLDPNDHRAHWMMAWALIFSGSPDEAIEYANTAIRLDPHYTAPNLYLLGLAHFSMGKLEDAVALMERAFAYNVELVGFSAPLAAAYSLLGQDEAAKIAMENYRNEWPWWGMSPNLQKVMQFFPFKDIDVSDRLADGLVKAGLPGQASEYYKVSKKDQLSGEEINSLTFGRTVTGISPFKPLVWRIHRTQNGEMTYQGNWPFSMMTPGESGSGNSWIEGDLLCDKWEYIFQGIKYCMTVYENHEGTSKEKNQYLFVTDFGIFPWSPAD